MHKPKISVILPVFNGQAYLNESIDSVLAQEYNDFEFLICDDGSVDNTINIIESKVDKRISFFKNANNLGQFKTLNILISHSKGEYVRLWSYDDIMKPDCLKQEIEFYNKYSEMGFCYCAFDYIDSLGKLISKAPEDKTPEIVYPDLAAQIMVYYGSITGSISNVMIKKDVLLDLGFFREDMLVAGDFEMFVRITKKYPIGFNHKSLIYLRSHSGQITHRVGIGLIFMREQQEIYVSLFERLPGEIKQYARKYIKCWCGIYHFNYIIHSLLIGDFKTAKDTCKFILRNENIFFAFFLWLISINGRLIKQKPMFSKGVK